MATAQTNRGGRERQAPQPSDTKPFGPPDMGLKVVSRPPTFRRAGFAFSAEPTTIRASDISEAQGVAITNDSNLVVQPVEMPPEEAEAEVKKD